MKIYSFTDSFRSSPALPTPTLVEGLLCASSVRQEVIQYEDLLTPGMDHLQGLRGWASPLPYFGFSFHIYKMEW